MIREIHLSQDLEVVPFGVYVKCIHVFHGVTREEKRKRSCRHLDFSNVWTNDVREMPLHIRSGERAKLLHPLGQAWVSHSRLRQDMIKAAVPYTFSDRTILKRE